MWYWLVMGLLIISMLFVVEKKSPLLFSSMKIITFGFLLCSVFKAPDLFISSHLWACFSLIFFSLCVIFETYAEIKKDRLITNEMTNSTKLQLLSFSLACFGYSWAFWVEVETLTWAVPVSMFALIVVVFFLLLPLLDRFASQAAIVAVLLWQLTWASGELWSADRLPLHLSSFIGTLLLALAVLMWAIHHFKQPFRYSEALINTTYFSAHTLILAPLILGQAA